MVPPWKVFSVTLRRSMNGAPCSPETGKQGNLITQGKQVMAIRVVFTKRANGLNLPRQTNAFMEMRSMERVDAEPSALPVPSTKVSTAL